MIAPPPAWLAVAPMMLACLFGLASASTMLPCLSNASYHSAVGLNLSAPLSLIWPAAAAFESFVNHTVMRSFPVVSLLAALVYAAPDPARVQVRATGSLSSWLSSESSASLQGILANVGSAGSNAKAAGSGITVASPSTTNPNYFYTWTRDSALTFKCLVDQFLAGDSSLESLIQDYITAQGTIQTIGNPSGGMCDGGLGEPKFNVNETDFSGSWGRPQRDGPALRATAMTAYARYLMSKGQSSTATSIILPMVQNDLSYVSQFWNFSSFDLWEEIGSSSFWTTAVQYRALVEGSALAKQLGSSCPNCDSQAPLALCFLQSYWTGSYARANTGGNRSGKDVNTILTSTHMFDPSASCDPLTFQPCSDKALANHKVVTDSFRPIYNVNKGIAEGQAVAVGRYPEDVYMGGNPWYLATFAAAEQLYDAIYQWNTIGSITITQTSLAFFKDLYPSAATGTYSSSSSQFESIVSAAQTYADGYMSIGQKYTPSNLQLAEQFSKDNGSPLSAVNLTWSYASFLTAYNARANKQPASWGASAAKLPSSCTGGSANGPCSAATNTVFPGRPTPTTPTCSSTPSNVAVTFFEQKQTVPGQDLYVVGSISQLGSWNTDNAVPLSANDYNSIQPVWMGTVSVPAGQAFQYKFIIKQSGQPIQYESDPNRQYTAKANCAGTATVNTSWR